MGSHEKPEWLRDERSIVAKQISRVRNSEKTIDQRPGNIYKNGKETIYKIGGLTHFFDYIKTLSSNRVLNVGVQNGMGSRRISQMPIATGLDFEVTALRLTSQLRENFPKEKIHLTGVETLRGINDESLAGVIGIDSIAFSDSIYLAVKRLDQVLVPGGAIKITFFIPDHSQVDPFDIKASRNSTPFLEAFIALGYDVAIVEKNTFIASGRQERFNNSIVLAIKPGNPNAPKAEELLHADLGAIQSEKKAQSLGDPIFDTSYD